MTTFFCVYQNVIEKIQHCSYNDELINKGIEDYIETEKIEDLVKSVTDDSVKQEIISSYVAPLLRMPEKYVVAFFENFAEIQKFKMISSEIAEEAYRCYRKLDSKKSASLLEKELLNSVNKMYKVESLKTMVKMEISENILDIDYINGRSEKMSIRLGRRVKLDDRKC